MPHRFFLRASRVAVCAGLVLLTAVATSTSASAQTLNLPTTSTGVHVGAPFLRCTKETWSIGSLDGTCLASSINTTLASLQGKIDTGFMWDYGLSSPSSLGSTLNLGASLKVDRSPGAVTQSPLYPSGAPVSLSQWQSAHPSWVEYTCATNSSGQHTTPAWEYGQVPSSPTSTAYVYVPLNVADAGLRTYFFNTYVKPSLDAGYRIILFDNAHLRWNGPGRCGHYDTSGHWVQQYSATNQYDPQYQTDMLNWLSWLRDQIHAYAPNALLAINYSAGEAGDTAAFYKQVYGIVDMVWDEGGFTSWGQQPLDSQHGEWNREFEALTYLDSQGSKASFINGLANTNPNVSAITSAQRQWILANYLLVKGAHTYMDILPNAYGTYYDFSEYHIPIGYTTAPAYYQQYVWWRTYTGGLAIVNPHLANHQITIPSGYTTLAGASISGSFTMAPTTALVLLKKSP